jgi:hypothetical protein
LSFFREDSFANDVAFAVLADGQTQASTYSFRTAQIKPGMRVSCSGTTNRCLVVPGTYLPANP